MKKVLIVLPNIPYPLDSGGNIGVYEMVYNLQEYLNIILLLPNGKSEYISELSGRLKKVEIRTYVAKEKSWKNYKKKLEYNLFYYYLKLIGKKLGFFVPKFKSGLYRDSLFFSYLSKDLIEKANEIILKDKPDFVQMEFFKLLPLISFLPATVKSIFVHHEIRYVRLYRQFKANSSDSLDGMQSFMYTQLKGIELEFLKKYDKVVCLSDVDTHTLRSELAKQEIINSPLILPPSKFYNPLNYSFDNSIVFVGGSSHSPNKDGLLWFINNIWPNVIDKNDSLKLKIIGKWSPEAISEVKFVRGVKFLGFVDNLYAEVKNSILVVPIQVGSGIRIKILDAANMGIPFVTTAVGVEGLSFVDGRDCYIRSEIEDFSKALLDLSESADLQNRFIVNAKKWLDLEFSYDKLMRLRRGIY